MLRHSARSPSITSQESYSAVMITDLIADVPVAVETEELPETTKEATNLAYDGQLDKGVPSTTLEDSTQRANGAGVTKGVLLNAVQFGQNDLKTKTDEKPIQMSGVLPVPTLTQQISEPKGFKDMSLLRKIAFGFSFLPSVLFVLCFAVILPCNIPPPCIQEWVREFNDTEVTSRLEIPENIVFTAQKTNGEGVLLNLNKAGGNFSEVLLDAHSNYLKCGKIMNKERTDCIIIGDNGLVYTFNNTHSSKLWDPMDEEDEHISNPVILSGCKDGMEDLAVISLAISSTKFKVLYNGNNVSTFTFSDCDTVPTRLMSWVINGSSNIVFICEKNGEERLVSIPKNVWCTYSKNLKEKPFILKSGAEDSLNKSVLYTLNEGIVLWSGVEASMIQPDGTYLWKVTNLSHPEENRFILYGNFHDENKQVALISSSLSSELKVTLLDPSNGKLIKSISHLNSEATDVTHVHGKKKDYILLLLKKTNNKDIVTAALTQINDISTTIVSLVSDEKVNHSLQHSILEELALLDLDGEIDTMKDISDSKNREYKRSLTAVSDGSSLSVYILSSSDNLQMEITEVRNINIENWDKSTKSRCKI